MVILEKKPVKENKSIYRTLREAQRQLNSAGNWGLLDIFGGNTSSGLMKHMKVNNASRCVEDARRDLATFRDELGDIRDIENLHVDIDGFLTFADFSLIGLLLISSFSQRSEKGRGKCRRQSEE